VSLERREVKLLSDLYLENEQGEEVLLKKDVISKFYVCINDINGVSQVLNKKGKPYKTRCRILHKDLGMVLVKHRFEEVKGWLNPSSNKIGFKSWKK